MAKTKAVEYKDKFTLDGRAKPQLGVTPAKVQAVQSLMEKALSGDRIANATLTEAVTTSDAMVNIAHLINLQFIPQIPMYERDLAGLVDFRTVPDFRPAVLQSIYGNGLTGPGVGANYAANEVPEGTPYPQVTVGNQESFYSKLSKRGVRFSWTFESQINDVIGFFSGLPSELLQLYSDSIYTEAFDALNMVSKNYAAITLPDGTTETANPVISAQAIMGAIIQHSRRTINGPRRLIGTLAGYNVIVPIGTKLYVEYMIRQALNIPFILPGTSGGTAYGQPAINAEILSTVTVVESDMVTGNNWFVVPKPGTTKGRPVWEVLKLQGYESPELRVNAQTGNYLGGGKVSPFEGSFDADTIDYRLRFFCGGTIWDPNFIVRSDGSGS